MTCAPPNRRTRAIAQHRHEREWIVAPPHADRLRLAEAARIPCQLAQVLLNRGISTADAIAPFLHPTFSALLAPDALPGAVQAADRLHAAVRQRRRIVIYGDYDVDGITATTILWHALRLAGAEVAFYVPSRLDEGYGLNAEAVEKLARDGAALLITVDCGITALEEARCARQLGLELIVTDHHQPHATLPEASVIVHPTALGPSANPDLSGAGVALKIAWALAQRVCGTPRVSAQFRDFLLDATAFAALGLIADVVPLMGENRVIASFGLRQLRQTRNAGLRALLEVAGLAGQASYDDYDVGFKLAPRLNAIGRMGHAQTAVELFTLATPEQARQIAMTLDAANRLRQDVERQIVKEAVALVQARGMDRENCRAIVLASPAWHPGVIGIVASRLVDRFRRPTVLIALEDGVGQGSGRSVRHFPLHEVLETCAAHLLSHGGHAMAAGVRLREDRVEAFAAAFTAQAAQRLTPADLRPRLHLDDELELRHLTHDVVHAIQLMAPFGTGNPRPAFCTGRVELAQQPRTVGRNGQHLQLVLRQDREVRRAIAFGMGPDADTIAEHRRLRVAFEPYINAWNGQRRVEMRIMDWKPAAT